MITSAEIPKLSEEGQPIEIAIVSDPEATGLSESVEALLADSGKFMFSRFAYHAGFGLKPPAACLCNPDVVVATLGAFEAINTPRLLASLQRAFQYRSLLVTTTRPETFDFFQLLKMGASDFVLPPLRRSELLPRLMRQVRATDHRDALVQKLKKDIGLEQIVGESPVLVDKIRLVPRFARCDATVLISGESGTGKELFGRAIHYLSPRADRAFIPVNCGALPENLVESEIFGHKRGAFTGAVSDQLGLIREADGGTLFLDEIDCLTNQAQVKLLRFLQDGEYRSIGSNQIHRANIRVITATNADFNYLVRSGKFREDLFYRLNVLTLKLPPLRERSSDVLLLAYDFLEKQAAILGSRPKILSHLALTRLLSHSWPGNVRELQNVLMRATVLSEGDSIEASDFDLPDDGFPAEDYSFQTVKSRVVWRFEHDFLTTVLRAYRGNITRAAFAVKKNRRAFWELLRKHNLLADVSPARQAHDG